MMNEALTMLADAQALLRSEVTPRGVGRMLVNGCQLKVAIPHADDGPADRLFASCLAATRGGLHVQLEWSTPGYAGGTLTARQLADSILETLIALRDDDRRHLAAKEAIERTVLEEIAFATRQGALMRLVRMGEVPIDPTNPGDRHHLAFVLFIGLLDPSDLEPDTHWFSASEPDEIGRRLRESIVPEQVGLAHRRQLVAATPAGSA